jgi:shikimate dehydrogenase
MKKYGLLGRELLHSLSTEIHRELGDSRYDLFQLEPDELDEFFEKREFAGINVTFPYKKDVMKYCDTITESAQKIGSVDTIVVDKDGKLVGDNCEYFGFCYMINKCGIDVSDKTVLILGTGNDSLTVQAVIKDLGAKNIIQVSSQEIENSETFYENNDVEIIVNTTPNGMYPNNGARFVDLGRFPKLCGVMELIYNPRRTRLICDAEDREIPNSDGLSMLVACAYQTEIKFGCIEPDEELIKRTYKTMSDRRKNIIFIGLPGCGKTTIAKVIAAKLGRPCIDVEKLISMMAGVPLSTVYMAYGERYYRELESETLEKITRNGGQVITCESGAVLSKENQYYIRQNGYVVWLSRELSGLKFDGVPLIKNYDALKRLDRERTPIYKFLADIKVDVTDNVEKTVSEIISKMNIKPTESIMD